MIVFDVVDVDVITGAVMAIDAPSTVTASFALISISPLPVVAFSTTLPAAEFAFSVSAPAVALIVVPVAPVAVSVLPAERAMVLPDD